MAIRKRRRQFFLFWNPPPPFWQIFISILDFKIDVPPRIIVASVKFIKNSKHTIELHLIFEKSSLKNQVQINTGPLKR